MKKDKLAYTGLEKLIADEALTALRALNEALDQMRANGWHESADRHLKISFIGARAALLAQGQTALSLEAIIHAENATYVDRLPAWNGYPDDPQGEKEQEGNE